jgi:uncharacterized protein (DUF302 family)
MSASSQSCEHVVIERSSINTGRGYEQVVADFERSIGRLDVAAAQGLKARGASWEEVETAMARMAGPSGLMLFTQIDQGAIASLAGTPIRCRLHLVGNPAIATRIVSIDVRGSLYVPFRVAIFESHNDDGAVICFDRPSSFLTALGHRELNEIGLMLDSKIDAVVRRVCASDHSN